MDGFKLTRRLHLERRDAAGGGAGLPAAEFIKNPRGYQWVARRTGAPTELHLRPAAAMLPSAPGPAGEQTRPAGSLMSKQLVMGKIRKP